MRQYTNIECLLKDIGKLFPVKSSGPKQAKMYDIIHMLEIEIHRAYDHWLSPFDTLDKILKHKDILNLSILIEGDFNSCSYNIIIQGITRTVNYVFGTDTGWTTVSTSDSIIYWYDGTSYFRQ